LKRKTILLFSITYFFYYWTRYNFPIALPFIKAEYGLTAAQIGSIATALTLGYAVGQLINGALVDRYGPRIMMTIGGLGAMLANLWMGGSMYFEMFIVAWLANGYFQAMGYPSTLKLVVNWFKPQEQGRAVGASEFAQSLASILILPLAGWLAVQYSWRLVFIVPALLMGLVSVWYWTQARDHPPDWDEVQEDKPLLRDMLARYRAALGDWRLVSADLSYGASQFVRYAMITWIPLYLVQTTGLGIFKAALAGAMFQVGGALGSLLVGWLADLPLFQPRRWVLIAGGMLVSAAAGVSVGLVPAERIWLIVVPLFICGVGIEALEVAYFLTPADFLGREMTATGVGCMNATGKLVASLQGITLGRVIDVFGYGAAFGVAGASGLVAAALILPLGLKRD
jgi:sugar phosphate permease